MITCTVTGGCDRIRDLDMHDWVLLLDPFVWEGNLRKWQACDARDSVLSQPSPPTSYAELERAIFEAECFTF